MTERVQNLDLFDGSVDGATQKLLLCLMVLESLHGSMDETHHRLLGELLQQGKVLLDSPELGEEGAGVLDFALRALVVRFPSYVFETIWLIVFAYPASRDPPIASFRHSHQHVSLFESPFFPSLTAGSSQLYRGLFSHHWPVGASRALPAAGICHQRPSSCVDSRLRRVPA
jgi:hypothetical protein